MGREAQRRAANMANRALRHLSAGMIGLRPEPGGTPLPKVETFDCECGAKWNKTGNTAHGGYCAHCSKPLVCKCGVLARKHRDGWDGNLLTCEEAARR